jgi:hypothetical protein
VRPDRRPRTVPRRAVVRGHRPEADYKHRYQCCRAPDPYPIAHRQPPLKDPIVRCRHSTQAVNHQHPPARPSFDASRRTPAEPAPKQSGHDLERQPALVFRHEHNPRRPAGRQRARQLHYPR